MKKRIAICQVLIFICSMLIIFLMSGPALAGTPTPTFPAIQPTATSASAYLRPTPTDIDFSSSTMPTFTPLDIDGMSTLTVSVYHGLNHNHMIDILVSVVMIASIVGLLVANISSDLRNTKR